MTTIRVSEAIETNRFDHGSKNIKRGNTTQFVVEVSDELLNKVGEEMLIEDRAELVRAALQVGLEQ